MKKVRRNVGLLDAYLRIMIGCLLLSCQHKKCHPVLAVMGSMKIAEGITRFCPCLYMLKKSTRQFL
ncbi:MAG: DUF2892 domain-containing protein [Lachnospiraceae bacterium]|jgi:hypothetical protein|nr:DUF2892 domain-containing protein [Lachnospiraceae bacterium]